MAHLLSPLVASVILSALPAQEVMDRFAPLEYRFTAGRYHDAPFLYRLFTPRSMDPHARYPLLVWLHGYGKEEFSQCNYGQLRHTGLVFTCPEDAQRHRFFMLAMQCPEDRRAWFDREGPSLRARPPSSIDEPGDVLMRLVDHLCQTQPIDPDRIYLVGISGGGSAAWEMVMRYPQRFAALAPLASGGGDLARAARLTAIPIWAFHTVNDLGAPAEPVQQLVADINRHGGNAYLTLVPGNDHDCWRAAFDEHRLLAWLLAQRRGRWSWKTPGYQSWTWWQLAAQVGLPGAIALAYLLERRRRAQVSRATNCPPIS